MFKQVHIVLNILSHQFLEVGAGLPTIAYLTCTSPTHDVWQV